MAAILTSPYCSTIFRDIPEGDEGFVGHVSFTSNKEQQQAVFSYYTDQ
jgi:hypothetical protein